MKIWIFSGKDMGLALHGDLTSFKNLEGLSTLHLPYPTCPNRISVA